MQHVPEDQDNLTEESFESLATVSKRKSVPRSTIYDWISKGLFPRPIRIGPRRVAWRTRDVNQ